MQPKVRRRFPWTPRGFAQRGARVLGRALVRCFARIEVVNPPDWNALGVVVLAPNHCSFADPVILQLACPRPVTFLMTESIYRLWWARWFFQLWCAIPVPDGGHPGAALKDALNALQQGSTVTIFPEGAVSRDGCLQRGHGGVAFLAARAAAPVIPVVMLGTFEFLPRTARWPRRCTIRVRFGAPLNPPDEEYPAADYAAEVMQVLADLGAPRRPQAS